MDSKIPYGTKWIRDLVPDVTWDAGTQSIKLPSGQVLPKSMYTIVDSKAYVKPEDIMNYTKPATPTTTQPQTSNTVPSGYTWIRDLVPDVSWNPADKSVTLPTGDVLPSNMYTMVGGKSYVNPYALANYYAPKPLDDQTLQEYMDRARGVYQPTIDNQYERINNLIATLQKKLEANIKSINSQGESARGNLQRQQTTDSNQLRNRSIARGTYTSGVADYEQGELAGEYAGRYSDLESALGSAIASANAEMSGQMSDLSYQASTLEDQFLDRIMGLVNTLVQQDTASQTDQYNRIIQAAEANRSQSAMDIEAAIARTQMFGRVVTESDAKALGVPIGTPSYQALTDQRAMQMRSYSGGNSGGGTSQVTTGGIDLYNMTTDQQRAFNAALDVWERTGVAPTGILQNFGVEAGAGYTPEIRSELQAMEGQAKALKLIQDRKVQGSMVSKEIAADCLSQTNYNRAAALNLLKSQRDSLIAAGYDVKEIERIINDFDAKGNVAPQPIRTFDSKGNAVPLNPPSTKKPPMTGPRRAQTLV